jgi:hypothetical protein
MHDGEKLRRYILANGGIIERDFTFFDGKYYDVIVGRKAEENEQFLPYTDAEYEFGRENLALMPEAFIARTKKQIGNLAKYLKIEGLQEDSRLDLERRKRVLEGVLSGEVK